MWARLPVRWLSSLVWAMLLGACSSEAPPALRSVGAPLRPTVETAHFDVAYHWAPIHHMAVETRGANALGGRADYLARVDFDGDWEGRNNWVNTATFDLAPYVYYSVAETSTHWFVLYMFFHPRDWVRHFFDTEHENDSEGLLLAIRRDGSPFGVLRAAVTVAHRHFYSYVPEGSPWQDGREDIDGTLSLELDEGRFRPVTAQEAQGHGLKAEPHYRIHSRGVTYYPSLERPREPNEPNQRGVGYALLNVFEPGGLWDQRYNPALFASWGTFAGDAPSGCGRRAIGCTRNAAHAPWAWDDVDDGVPAGAMALDPAGLMAQYFRIPEPFGRSYLRNDYLLDERSPQLASLTNRPE